MKRVLAIARLTFSEGVRMRVVLVFVVFLIAIVLRFPAVVRGDETLSGRVQSFLFYSLSALSVFMSLATIFFSCATLTNDIRFRTIHTVATKPVTRFQILLGKWIGVNMLNLLIVALTGLTIYAFAVYLKNRPVKFDRDRVLLDNAIWASRIAARPTEPDFSKLADEHIEQLRAKNEPFDEVASRAAFIKDQREKWITIPPGEERVYLFENLPKPEGDDGVYQVRFKARGIPYPMDENIAVSWAILDPDTGEVLQTMETLERHSETHQFLIRSAAIRNGRAAIGVASPMIEGRRPLSIYFEGRGALEVLYRVGSFENNYMRTLALILCRLAFLSAVGLFFSTFCGFPVASFCVMSMYLFCIGVPWWMESIGANLEIIDPKVDPYGAWGPMVRSVFLPPLLLLLPNFVEYDGVESLIDGYVVGNEKMILSVSHTLIYGVILLAAPGWLIFRSREIAEQTT